MTEDIRGGEGIPHMVDIISPDTYNQNFACGNCSSSVGLRIPLGITIQDYAKEHKCPSCGCMLIPQDTQPYRYTENAPMLYLPYYGLRR